MLVGCTRTLPVAPTPAPAASPPYFSCRGPASPPVVTRAHHPPAPPGRLVVQRLAPPPGTPRAREEHDDPPLPFAGVRLRVVAENAPIARFAAALAEALGVAVIVPLDAHDLQVTVSSPDVTVDDLLRLLPLVGVQHELSPRGLLRLAATETLSEVIARNEWRNDLRTARRVFAPRAGVPFAEIARHYCDHLASTHGTADVVDGRLVVHDFETYIESVERLLRAFESRGASQVRLGGRP